MTYSANAVADGMRLHKDPQGLGGCLDNGEAFDLAAEYLRVRSPSAEVQGHSAASRKNRRGKRNVAILEVHPIGNYAVRLVFDDMHSTGIYSWDYLLELGRNHAAYCRSTSTSSPPRGSKVANGEWRIANRKVRPQLLAIHYSLFALFTAATITVAPTCTRL